MEKISWTDCVRNKEVLHSVREKNDILIQQNEKKANWTAYILRRK
jgi:hypothetical protein